MRHSAKVIVCHSAASDPQSVPVRTRSSSDVGYWTTTEENGSAPRVGVGDPARRHSLPDSDAVKPEWVPITSAKTVLSQGRTR